MDHYESTVAIVIKTNVVKESDIRVTLLTPHLGKINALAKGARNIKSTRLGSLQLGNLIKCHLYKKGDYLWISEATSVTQFLRDPKSLTQLNLLFYFLEILNYFIADNQQIDGIYQVSAQIIEAVNKNHLIRFIDREIEFLNLLGFGVPENISQLFADKDYIGCQKQLKIYLESIIEKKLESNELFK